MFAESHSGSRVRSCQVEKIERLESASVMTCIFCLTPGAVASIEHVIPKALGAELQTDRVCTDCNSTLGHDVDGVLVNHAVMQFKRAGHGLAGNSGAVPDMTKKLLGRKGTTVTNGLEHEIVVRADEGGIHDLYVVPKIEALYDATTGAVSLKGIMDARDIAHLRKRVKMALEEGAVPRHLHEDILSQVTPVAGSSQVTVSYRIPLAVGDIHRALAKIAYELAWRWLGDTYLDDPQAVALRAFVLGQANSAPDIAVSMDEPFIATLAGFGSPPHEHLAFLLPNRAGLQVVVKLFDAVAAIVRITTHAHHVHAMPYRPVVRFDTSSRTHRDLTIIEFAAAFDPHAAAMAT